MLKKSRQGDLVKAMVEIEVLLKKKSRYTETAGSSFILNDLPVLLKGKLKKVTLDVYQLKQTPLYAMKK